MKILKLTLASAALIFAAAACGDGESSNPATESRSDLNPPSGLVSLTGDGQVTLRWKGNNTEDAFQGYHVFAYKGDVTTETAKVKYPNANVSLAQGSLPRCKDNSALFELFGFPADTERDCEGDSVADGEVPAAGAAADALFLQDEETEVVAKLGAIVKCAGSGTGAISLPIPANSEGKKSALGTQSCVVTQFPDASGSMVDLVNGEVYSFFVASVLGDENENISWTSNFVVDSPATQVFSGDLTIEAGKVLSLPLAKLMSPTATTSLLAIDPITKDDFSAPVNCDTTNGCSITTKNTTAIAGLSFGRLGTGAYKSRVFFSTSTRAGGNYTLNYAYRGAQTLDAGSETAINTTIPGDRPVDYNDGADPFVLDGLPTPVYGNQVFDLALVDSTDDSVTYGKVVVTDKTLEGEAATGTVTLSVTILMQEAKGVRYYLK